MSEANILCRSEVTGERLQTAAKNHDSMKPKRASRNEAKETPFGNTSTAL